MWVRRLRILYQIDKGRNYGDVIDSILSILQFIPTTLLLSHVHMTIDTYATDEILLNDLARARLYVLEEWTADGESHRSVTLAESFRTMSPNALLIAQETISTTNQENQTQDNSFQATTITSSDTEDEIQINIIDRND